jgi:two-component system response regulator PilR (NtrC family)
VRKIGATGEDAVDVRIISATHNDLGEQVRRGEFRQDLYYRLSVIPIQMPALRESREDIPEIAQRILERLRGDEGVHFSAEALRALQGYSFPGNVRELENIIERAFALCSQGVIEENDLLLVPVEHEQQSDNAALSSKYPLPKYLDQVEKQALLEALEQTGFNRTAAAKLLGLTFRTMRYRMERLGIKGPHGTDDAE